MAAADWNIQIDLTALEAAIKTAATPRMDLLQQSLMDAAAYVRQTWQSAVQGTLLPGMTRALVDDDYYESLETGQSLQMIAPLHAAVISLYPGLERIEDGYPSFDMKPGLLSGPSARRSKAGNRYNVIPFRHMTPGSNSDATAGKRAHGATMPQSVYKIVKKSGIFVDPGDADAGEQFGQRSKLARQINLNAAIHGSNLPMGGNYTWKAGMYQGMRQSTKQYGTRTQSTYWTFRAVSDLSDKDSWMHPGQMPNPIVESVIAATKDQVQLMVMAGARAAFGVD